MPEPLDPIPMPVPLGLYLAAGGDPRNAFTGHGWEFFCDRVEMLLNVGPDEGDGDAYRQIAQLASERRLPVLRDKPRSEADWVNSVTYSSWEADLRDDPTLVEQLVSFLPENLATRLTDPMAARSHDLVAWSHVLREDVLSDIHRILNDAIPKLRGLFATMPDEVETTLAEENTWHAKYPGYAAFIDALTEICDLVEPVKTSSTLEPLEVDA